MKLEEFKTQLSAHPQQGLAFLLPNGDPVPAHYHVTEVGHVRKTFIDCGGTSRSASTIQLQLWLGGDGDHRLSAGKLAKIIDLAKPILPGEDLEVEVEYEAETISQYGVRSGMAGNGTLTFQLGEKHTDCLAKEACGTSEPSEGESACCSGTGCC